MTDKNAPSLETQAMLLASNLRHSRESHLRTSHTETVWKYRAYQGGEPAQMIDWKLSARGRELFVREHELIRHRRTFFWSSFEGAAEVEQHTHLVLLALAYVMVEKERTVGWLVDGLPTTQTSSQVASLFETAMMRLGKTKSNAPDKQKVKNDFVIFAADFTHAGEPMLAAVKTYAAQGNHGILLNLGPTFDEKTNPVTLTARNAQWPVVHLSPEDRPDITLAHLLEKTVQATR